MRFMTRVIQMSKRLKTYYSPITKVAGGMDFLINLSLCVKVRLMGCRRAEA